MCSWSGITLGDPQWGRGLAGLLTNADVWVLLSPVEGAEHARQFMLQPHSCCGPAFTTAAPSPDGSLLEVLITLVDVVASGGT